MGEKESNECTLQKHQQQMRDELNGKLADCQEYRAVVNKLQEKLKEQEGEQDRGVLIVHCVCMCAAAGRKALCRACSQQSCSGSCTLLLLLHPVAAALAQQEKEAAAACLQAAEREKGVIAQQLQEALQGQAAAEACLQAVQLEVQVAKAGLQEADEHVAAMRSAAAAANTDLNGKLAAKSAQLQELQDNNNKLNEQLAGAQAAKAQAAAHAGDRGPLLLLCAAFVLTVAPKEACCPV